MENIDMINITRALESKDMKNAMYKLGFDLFAFKNNLYFIGINNSLIIRLSLDENTFYTYPIANYRELKDCRLQQLSGRNKNQKLKRRKKRRR